MPASLYFTRESLSVNVVRCSIRNVRARVSHFCCVCLHEDDFPKRHADQQLPQLNGSQIMATKKVSLLCSSLCSAPLKVPTFTLKPLKGARIKMPGVMSLIPPNLTFRRKSE